MTAAEKKYIEELVKKEEGRLLGFIRKRVDHEEDARDIAQDVFYQLTVGFDDIRSVTSITSLALYGGAQPDYRSFQEKQTGTPLRQGGDRCGRGRWSTDAGGYSAFSYPLS